MSEMAEVKPVFLVPCSGIGKVHGLIGREAVFKVVQELRPGAGELACLAEIVTQDEDIKARLRDRLAITVDGCPLKCAEKNVAWAGGENLCFSAGDRCLPAAPGGSGRGRYLADG